MSFIKVVISQPPIKATCPTPEIYPGSEMYQELVYSNLPVGLAVRQPTPCGLSSCTLYTYKRSRCCSTSQRRDWLDSDVRDEISAPAHGVSTHHNIFALRLSGAPGCTATFYCEEQCKVDASEVQPYKFVFAIRADGEDRKFSTYDLPAWLTDRDRKSGRMWGNLQNAKVSVRTSPIQPPSTHTWAFAKDISDGRDTIAAINRGPLGTGQTELWLARKNNKKVWIGPTALPSTDRGEWAFAMMGSGLMAIKMGPETASGKTEVYITNGRSHHMFLKHHYATALGLTDIRHGKWAFCLMLKNHLMAIKMGPVTELQILSADSQYTSFHQTKTTIPISSTDRGEWAFEVMRNDDLMVIKKGPETESGRTEVQILSASSGYKSFSVTTKATGLPLTDSRHGEWAFALMFNNDLMAIERKQETGEMWGMRTNLRILSATSKYASLSAENTEAWRLHDRFDM